MGFFVIFGGFSQGKQSQFIRSEFGVLCAANMNLKKQSQFWYPAF